MLVEVNLKMDIPLKLHSWWLFIWEQFRTHNRHHSQHLSKEKSTKSTYQSSHLSAIMQHWQDWVYTWETHQEDQVTHTAHTCLSSSHIPHNYAIPRTPT